MLASFFRTMKALFLSSNNEEYSSLSYMMDTKFSVTCVISSSLVILGIVCEKNLTVLAIRSDIFLFLGTYTLWNL